MGKSKPKPRWKTPKKEKRFKEERPKQAKSSQNDAWKNLKEWFWSVRKSTYLSCGFTEEQFNDYFKQDRTKYYEQRHNQHIEKTSRNRGNKDKFKRS